VYLVALILLLFLAVNSSAAEEAADTLVPGDVLRHGKALLIGVSDYDDKRWDQLSDVAPQLESLKHEFSNHFDDVRVELNKSGDEIRLLIKNFLPSKTATNARMLIYYSGHGYDELYRDKSAFVGFVTGKDTPFVQKGNDASYDAARPNAISMDDIRTDLSNSKAASVIFIFDSCFSGSFFLDKSGREEVTPLPDEVVRRLLEERARYVITACRMDEPVPAHSSIPDLIVKALHGEADLFRSGVFSGDEMTLYLQNQMLLRKDISLNPQGGPLPEYHDGKFIFRAAINLAGVMTSSKGPTRFDPEAVGLYKDAAQKGDPTGQYASEIAF
jgi:hypothetical protein